MKKIINLYKKIKNWLIKDSIGLEKKRWHRFLKVLFILSIIALTVFFIVSLANAYSSIVNQWNFSDTVSNKLNKENYAGKVVSVNELYGDKEIISDKSPYSQGYLPNLKNKDFLLPYSLPVFMSDTKSFCSSNLDKQIREIATQNNISLFSPINPNINTLSNNIDQFVSYLKTNSYYINCVMVDSYSIENDNGSISKYTFLRPIDTHELVIYGYENNFIGFILTTLLVPIGILVYTFIMLFIYNKILLYIIYGKKE